MEEIKSLREQIGLKDKRIRQLEDEMVLLRRSGIKTQGESDCWYMYKWDKTNKMTVHPAKTQISLGIRPVWSESTLCAQWITKDPRVLHADSECSDQTGRMPRLIWVFNGRTCHFVGFVMRRLKSKLLGLGKQCRHRSDCFLLLITVYTVCHSFCILWIQYCQVKPYGLHFVIVTVIIS